MTRVRRLSPPTCPPASTRRPARWPGRPFAPSPRRPSTRPSRGSGSIPGKAHAGVVEVIAIGIPDGAPVEPEIGLILPAVLAGMPRRSAESTKFSSGNVYVLGGSPGLTGAPTMASLAAMRTGAGYVTLGAPASLEATFTARPVEAMMRGLPDDDGGLTEAAAEPALEAIARADAVVLGPGLGRTDGARAFARTLFERVEVPLVVDADGLNALAGAHFPRAARPTVLTPHAGELGRLLDIDSAAVGRRAVSTCARPRGDRVRSWS